MVFQQTDNHLNPIIFPKFSFNPKNCIHCKSIWCKLRSDTKHFEKCLRPKKNRKLRIFTPFFTKRFFPRNRLNFFGKCGLFSNYRQSYWGDNDINCTRFYTFGTIQNDFGSKIGRIHPENGMHPTKVPAIFLAWNSIDFKDFFCLIDQF